jgi:hypothetical protein
VTEGSGGRDYRINQPSRILRSTTRTQMTLTDLTPAPFRCGEGNDDNVVSFGKLGSRSW